MLALIVLMAFLFFRELIARFFAWLFSREQPTKSRFDNPHRFANELRSMDLDNLNGELEARREELTILQRQQATQKELDAVEDQISRMQTEVDRREHEA